jgi:hypothetical protein
MSDDSPASTPVEPATGARASASAFDPGIVGIVLANALTLWVAWTQHWPIALLLWPYWLQSLVIGAFARQRIRALQRFSTARLFFGGEPAAPTAAVRDQIADFLALHFGIFHAVYLVFLIAAALFGDAGARPTGRDALLILALGVGFAVAQGLAHRRQVREDRDHEPNLGSLLLLPYPRVLPMHVMILLGAFVASGPLALALFTLLKTAADVAMHVIERRWLRSADGGLRMPVHIG